jgi:hypothetical protein
MENKAFKCAQWITRAPFYHHKLPFCQGIYAIEKLAYVKFSDSAWLTQRTAPFEKLVEQHPSRWRRGSTGFSPLMASLS